MEVRVRRFKSIYEAFLDLKRVNVMIGPPETGKSNLLEALSIFSLLGQIKNYINSGLVSPVSIGGGLWSLQGLSEILRMMTRARKLDDIFFAFSREEPIEVELDGKRMKCSYDSEKRALSVCLQEEEILEVDEYMNIRTRREDLEGLPEDVKFYRYSEGKEVQKEVQFGDFLLPPHGPNLMHLLRTRDDLRRIATRILDDFNIKLTLIMPEGRIEFLKPRNGEHLRIEHHMLSDTAKRTLFCLGAVESNRDSLVLMEEPEAHSFPFYTKFLAERIALSDNSYIVTTHNPYFLETLVEKIPEGDISVYLSRASGWETKYERREVSEIRRIVAEGGDVFFELGGGD